MSWVSASMKQEHPRSIENILGAQGYDKPESRRRGYLAVLTLIISGMIIYTSLPYAGAFVDVGKMVGFSTVEISIDDAPRIVTNSQKYKKVYLRSGQSLKAEYSLPEKSQLDLVVKQCAQRPILEVISCKPIGEQTITITSPREGSHLIQVNEPGFYYFGDTLKSPEGKELKYSLIWTRG